MIIEIANKAVELLNDKLYIIFGSGSTVNQIIDTLAETHQNLESLIAFSASASTSNKLQEYKIQEGSLAYLNTLSNTQDLICVDSVDEIIIGSPINSSVLIKGHGAALLREKIVWKLAKKVIVVLNQEKITTNFTKFIPIEVTPFAYNQVIKSVKKMKHGFQPVLRVHGRSNSPVITDNGNYLIDLHYTDLSVEITQLHTELKLLLGVVETGIFSKENFKEIELVIGYEEKVDVLV